MCGLRAGVQLNGTIQTFTWYPILPNNCFMLGVGYVGSRLSNVGGSANGRDASFYPYNQLHTLAFGRASRYDAHEAKRENHVLSNPTTYTGLSHGGRYAQSHEHYRLKTHSIVSHIKHDGGTQDDSESPDGYLTYSHNYSTGNRLSKGGVSFYQSGECAVGELGSLWGTRIDSGGHGLPVNLEKSRLGQSYKTKLRLSITILQTTKGVKSCMVFFLQYC